MALGTGELLLLAVIAVIFLGPKEVYKIAHKMGGWMREIQKMSQEFMRELNREADSIERAEKSVPTDKNVFVTGGSANAATSVATPSIADQQSEPMVTDDNPASVLGGPNTPPETTPEVAPDAPSVASADSASESISTDEEKSSS